MRDGPFHLFWAEDTPNQSVMEPWYYKYLGEHGRDIINVIAFQIKLAWVTAVVSFTYFIPSALMLIRDYGIVDNVAALCGVNRFYLLNVVFIVVNGWSILPERGPHLWFAYGNSFFMLLFYSIIPFIFNENDYPFISDLITTKAPSDQQKWYLLSIMLITSTITGWIVAPVTSPRDPNTHLVRHIISKARTQCYFSIWQCHKMFLIVGIVQIANNKDLSDTSRVLTFGIGFSVTKFIILRLMGKVLEKYKDLIPKGTIVDEEVERKTKEGLLKLFLVTNVFLNIIPTYSIFKCAGNYALFTEQFLIHAALSKSAWLIYTNTAQRFFHQVEAMLGRLSRKKKMVIPSTTLASSPVPSDVTVSDNVIAASSSEEPPIDQHQRPSSFEQSVAPVTHAKRKVTRRVSLIVKDRLTTLGPEVIMRETSDMITIYMSFCASLPIIRANYFFPVGGGGVNVNQEDELRVSPSKYVDVIFCFVFISLAYQCILSFIGLVLCEKSGISIVHDKEYLIKLRYPAIKETMRAHFGANLVMGSVLMCIAAAEA